MSDDNSNNDGKPKLSDPPVLAPVQIAQMQDDLSDLVSRLAASDVENLDVEKLREGMLRGMMILEHCLYSQAGKEYTRIGAMRALMNSLESEIFKPEEIAKLEPGQKIQVYRLLTDNLNTSLTFLQTLHRDSATSLETVTSIEKIKSARPVDRVTTGVDRVKLEQIKKLVELRIKDKVNERKKDVE